MAETLPSPANDPLACFSVKPASRSHLGVGETSFLKTRQFEARNGRETGNETEFETRNGREMGNETEFETRNGHKWETRRYKIHHFSTKNEKSREKTGKTGGKKHTKKEKTGEKNRKLQEIQKRDFEEVPGNAENGNEFLARFQEMLKPETETRSSRMSQNDDSRAKTMYRPTPTPTSFSTGVNI